MNLEFCAAIRIYGARSYDAGRGPIIDASIRDTSTTVYDTMCEFHNSQRDVGRESQRPCVTSPSNIDLSATSSMLIPHSNSRSSCGARARFARAGDRRTAENGVRPTIALKFAGIARAVAEERARSRFADTERKIRHMTGPRHSYGAPTLPNTIPPLSRLHDQGPSPSRLTGTSSGPKMKGTLRKALRLIGGTGPDKCRKIC